MADEPIQGNETPAAPAPTAAPAPFDYLTPDEHTAYFDRQFHMTTDRRAAHEAAVVKVTQHHILGEHKATTAPIPTTEKDYKPFAGGNPLDVLTKDQRAAYFDKNALGHDEAVALVEKETERMELESGEKALVESLPPLPAGKSWDAGMAAEVIGIAEESGVPIEDLNAAFEAYAKGGSATILSYEQAEATMRQKWGADYESKLSAAKDALRAFPALLDFLDRTRLGNDPAILIHLAEKGISRQAIQAEIDRVTNDPKSAYRDAHNSGHEAEVERIRLLFKRLYA